MTARILRSAGATFPVRRRLAWMEQIVDFHTHYIPETIANFHADGCTGLVIETPTCGQMYEGGKHYRTIDERCWDAARRIADMDERGIGMQVISPIPVTNSYASAVKDGKEFARLHNDGIAEVVRERPDRFAGLGAIPLQDVDAACRELHYIRKDLRLLGVEIGTTAAGRELDDPALIPFWEQCNELRTIVFIHPETAPGFERHRNIVGFIAAAAYPSENGIIASKLLLGNYLTRFPNVKIVLSHGGGTLPWLLPRIDRFWETSPPGKTVRAKLDVRPSLEARKFYVDTLVFDRDNLELVAKRFGNDHLMVGSDYPFGVMEDPPGAILKDVAFDAATSDAIRHGNYERLAAAVNGSSA
jgi:aminocarboxymuconate-semialdehyde decarboxylase